MNLDNGRMERDGEELPECQQDGRTRHRPVAVAVVLSGQPFDVELYSNLRDKCSYDQARKLTLFILTLSIGFDARTLWLYG